MSMNRPPHLKITWSTVCLSVALLLETAWAEQTSLGGVYHRFDDLFIVASGPDAVQNCFNLRATILAVSGIGTVRLPPATYDCGSTTLVVPEGVKIEGSGQLTTRITGQTITTFNSVVIVANGGEICQLLVENTIVGSADVAQAIEVQAGSVLREVTVKSTGTGNNENVGVLVKGTGIRILLSHVTIQVNGGSSFNEGVLSSEDSEVILEHVNIDVTDGISSGVFVLSGSPSYTIRNSVISGTDEAIGRLGGAGNYKISYSNILNGINNPVQKCYSVYDENLDLLNPDCSSPVPP